MYILFGSTLGFSRILEILYGVRFDGVHAFSYNSAESETIWMKFGGPWAHCLSLVLPDFGRDPLSSKNGRARPIFVFIFWATVCKTVRPMLSDRCPVLSVCLSCPVCDVRALWPHGWMDQNETWHVGRPQPRTYRVRWGPSSSPPEGHSPQFSTHICCGPMAA